jgi:Sec-independent protein translocase protein TatA
VNPALIIIVIILCVAIWVLASALYKPIGKWIGRICKDAIDTMKEEDKNESEEEN